MTTFFIFILVAIALILAFHAKDLMRDLEAQLSRYYVQQAEHLFEINQLNERHRQTVAMYERVISKMNVSDSLEFSPEDDE